MEECELCNSIVHAYGEDHYECPNCKAIMGKSRANKQFVMNRFYNNQPNACKYEDMFYDEMRKSDEILQEISKRIPIPGRLFHVEAGGGFLLTLAKERGWIIDGSDIRYKLSKWAMDRFGVRITHGFFDDIAETRLNDSYDAVIISSLNNQPNPRKTIESAHRLLCDNGILYISNYHTFESIWALKRKSLDFIDGIGFEHIRTDISPDKIEAVYKKK